VEGLSKLHGQHCALGKIAVEVVTNTRGQH